MVTIASIFMVVLGLLVLKAYLYNTAPASAPQIEYFPPNSPNLIHFPINIIQVTALFAVIKAVANYKLVGDIKAYVSQFFHADLNSHGLKQQGANFY